MSAELRDPFTGLDPWPNARPQMIVFEYDQGKRKTYAVGGGRRLLVVPNRCIQPTAEEVGEPREETEQSALPR